METLLVAGGREDLVRPGGVNPPIQRASSIVFSSLDEFDRAHANPFDSLLYGRLGTATTFAFESAMAAVEGGYRSIATASGLSAIVASLSAFVSSGDHILVADTAYDPVRRFCERRLRGLGVEITYYDPSLGADIAALFQPNTRLIYLESPGSLTMEVQDVPAIASAARAAGIVVVIDNTWASPIFFRSFEHGADVVIQSCTKYVAGHSDALIGAITTTRETYEQVRKAAQDLGACAGSEECYMALRGLRTLKLRMRQHQENALALAHFLAGREEVDEILYPALPGAAGHDLWARDFLGASGLLSVVLKPCSRTALANMIDHLDHYSIGFSWGGYESQILPANPAPARTARPWDRTGQLVRIHVGLESVDDLIADLGAGLERLGRN